jgi:hypothetical protein
MSPIEYDARILVFWETMRDNPLGNLIWLFAEQYNYEEHHDATETLMKLIESFGCVTSPSDPKTRNCYDGLSGYNDVRPVRKYQCSTTEHFGIPLLKDEYCSCHYGEENGYGQCYIQVVPSLLNGSPQTVQQLIDARNARTESCPECRKEELHVSDIVISNMRLLPKVIIVCVCRGGSPVKNSIPINMADSCDIWLGDPTTSDEDRAKYTLAAYVEHSGEDAKGGHYIAFCREAETNKWFRFDDAKVAENDKFPAVHDNGSILLYTRSV